MRLGRRPWIGISFFLAALSFASAAGAADGPPLAWRLEKGEVLRLRSTSDQRSELIFAEAPAGTEPSRSSLKTVLVWRLAVIEVDPAGRARVACKYESVKLEGEQAILGKFGFDSAKEDPEKVSDPRSRPYARLVGQEFTFVLAPDGGVTGLTGLDRVRAAMLHGNEENPVAVADIQAHMGDDAVRAQLEGSYRVLPEDPLAPAGATWRHATERFLPLLGGVRYETAYTLAARGDDRAPARIVFETAIVKGEAPPDPTVPQHGLVSLAFKGGKGKGEVDFDPRLGRIVRGKQQLEMETDASVAGSEGQPASKATSRVRLDSTLELLKAGE